MKTVYLELGNHKINITKDLQQKTIYELVKDMKLKIVDVDADLEGCSVLFDRFTETRIEKSCILNHLLEDDLDEHESKRRFLF